MKTVIIYASVHHGNTKKIIDAIVKAAEEDSVNAADNTADDITDRSWVIDLIDATKVKEADISSYDLIGFASGLYFSKLHQSVLDFAAANLPEDKKVFFITTYGGKEAWDSIENIAIVKHAEIVGRFGCKGYDTYGPFKLVGGLCKGHPDDKDLADAVDFYKSLL